MASHNGAGATTATANVKIGASLDTLVAPVNGDLVTQVEEQETQAPPEPPKANGKLWAIADLHLSYKDNRELLATLDPRPEDDLIIAGDVGESVEQLRLAFSTCKKLFRRIWWVPGNHELYTMPLSEDARGEAKYKACVAVAREHGVLTPEDDFELWEGQGGPVIICPLFLLYDYSFRPPDVSRDSAIKWAQEAKIEATDEALLQNDPWLSRDEWCHHLVNKFAAKLEAARARHPGVPTVLINHWPLTEEVLELLAIPRFSLWCGTKLTADWGTRFDAKVVVSGHVHLRRTDWIDGVRYEECSLGYPRQWAMAKSYGKGINDLMREILPGPPAPPGGNLPPRFRQRFG